MPVHKLSCTRRCLQCTIVHTKIVHTCRHCALEQKYQQRSPFARLHTNTDKNQPSMCYVRSSLHLIRYFLKQYYVSRSNIGFLCSSYMLRFERAPCMRFCFDCGRAILGQSVKCPGCRNRQKIIHRGLPQPRSQVLIV